MKEQIGISVTIGHGDLLNKVMILTDILVTISHLDATIAECAGTLQVLDTDVEQTLMALVPLKRSFFKQVRMKYF